MATFQTMNRVQREVTLSAVLMALVSLCSSGCVTLGEWAEPAKAKEIPVQIAARWQNEVGFAPDPTNGGRMTPGIVGRVYLFGQEINKPMESDGALHVEVSEIVNGQAKVLEQWTLDPPTLQRHQRKDVIGAGYSIFLPWGTYRPDIAHVQMRVAFQPVKGTPLYAPPSSVILSKGGMPMMGGPSIAKGPTK